MAAHADPNSLTHERIGRYHVLGQLATGGMAEILLGRLIGPAQFERPVVIKRILPHLADQKSFVDMFVDEARIVAEIRHPNVVHVEELGLDGDSVFLVMEYLAGESVSGLMRRLWSRGEHLDHALAVHIVTEACAGLHAAHELEDEDGRPRHLVHRDVSPQNLFVTYSGEVKVLDFGIAKVADQGSRTEAGQVKGKFQYMSPEQCQGKALDRRSDIFALGVVLYELITSRMLFKRQTQFLTFKAICDEPTPPASSFVPDLAAGLEAVCLKALAKRPNDRYRTAGEMRRDLLAVARTLATERPPEEELSRLLQRMFAERIEEKREFLRRFRTGSAITSVPAAEIDVDFEAPTIEERPPSASTNEMPGRPLRRSLAILLAAVIALVAMGAFALWFRTLSHHPSRAVASAPSASVPFESTPAREPETREVTLHVESLPTAATLRINGIQKCETPCDLRIPFGSGPLAMELKKEGFLPATQNVVPNVDQRFVLSMAPAPKPRASARPASRATDPYFRFE